jgi:hypothetical protein
VNLTVLDLPSPLTHGPSHFFSFFILLEKVTGDLKSFHQMNALSQLIKSVSFDGCSQTVNNGFNSELYASQVCSSVPPLTEGEMSLFSFDGSCSLAHDFGSFIQMKQV